MKMYINTSGRLNQQLSKCILGEHSRSLSSSRPNLKKASGNNEWPDPVGEANDLEVAKMATHLANSLFSAPKIAFSVIMLGDFLSWVASRRRVNSSIQSENMICFWHINIVKLHCCWCCYCSCSSSCCCRCCHHSRFRQLHRKRIL